MIAFGEFEITTTRSIFWVIIWTWVRKLKLIKPTHRANRQPILFTNRLLNTYSIESWDDEATVLLLLFADASSWLDSFPYISKLWTFRRTGWQPQKVYSIGIGRDRDRVYWNSGASRTRMTDENRARYKARERFTSLLGLDVLARSQHITHIRTGGHLHPT